MSAQREIIISLPEPLSLNALIRMSYHLRNARREMLKKAIAKQLPRDWRPMRYARADAIFTLRALRDDFELPASLKIEMDAAQEINLIHSDAPTHFVRGIISQRTGSARGVRIRFTELDARPQQPRVDF